MVFRAFVTHKNDESSPKPVQSASAFSSRPGVLDWDLRRELFVVAISGRADRRDRVFERIDRLRREEEVVDSGVGVIAGGVLCGTGVGGVGKAI